MLAQIGAFGTPAAAPAVANPGKDEDGFDDEIFISDDTSKEKGINDAL